MKIATWNINSVRLRLPIVQEFVEKEQPDVLCLQETKVMDELFPKEGLQALGFEYIAFKGQKSYNGVAILSKIPFVDSQAIDIANQGEARHVCATLSNGVTVHNFYIPAGGDEPDVTINPKFKAKLEFVDAMKAWFANNANADSRLIAVGDFNIAPYEHDVWSHKQLLKVVSHTPIEVEKLLALRDGLDWVDVARHFVPQDQKLYSWWSYRNRNWRQSNRGRRLDHIWVTPLLKETLQSYQTHDYARDWEKPSDHVPIVAQMDI
jgi:exodeoxyribonuclease-3